MSTFNKRGRPKARVRPIIDYADMSRRERERHKEYASEQLNDTDAAAGDCYWRARIASLALEPYGTKLVPTAIIDPSVGGGTGVTHVIHTNHFKARRQISGSVWDGRKLIWRAPKVTDYPHKPRNLRMGPKIRFAHRNWESVKQQVAAAREPFKPRGDDPAAAEAMLFAIGHLATPETKRARKFLDEGVNERMAAKRDLLPDPKEALPRPPFLHHGDTISTFLADVSLAWCPPLIPGRNAGTRPRSFKPWVTWVATRPGFTGPLSELLDRLGDDWRGLGLGNPWIGGVIPQDIFKVSYAPQKRPNVAYDDPERARARLWNWVMNSLHRDQMQIKWPQLSFHGPCAVHLDRFPGRAFQDDLGGYCCRYARLFPREHGSRQWTRMAFKSCPLQCWARWKRSKDPADAGT